MAPSPEWFTEVGEVTAIAFAERSWNIRSQSTASERDFSKLHDHDAPAHQPPHASALNKQCDLTTNNPPI